MRRIKDDILTESFCQNYREIQECDQKMQVFRLGEMGRVRRLETIQFSAGVRGTPGEGESGIALYR